MFVSSVRFSFRAGIGGSSMSTRRTKNGGTADGVCLIGGAFPADAVGRPGGRTVGANRRGQAHTRPHAATAWHPADLLEQHGTSRGITPRHVPGLTTDQKVRGSNPFGCTSG